MRGVSWVNVYEGEGRRGSSVALRGHNVGMRFGCDAVAILDVHLGFYDVRLVAYSTALGRESLPI